jgi:hypothetical protein
VGQRSRYGVELGVSSSIELSFRVLSIQSFEKFAGQQYYVRTSAGPTNHLEEIDGVGLIYTSSRTPEIHYRDHDGEHVIAFDLNKCGANSGWENSHGSEAYHSAQHPSPMAGVPQPLCPTR